MTAVRKIIHIDMDAFYASVEQRDQPALKGRPVIVGGAPERRGVVAACSYEARKFGIHSAMASRTAYRLCPHAEFIRPRFDVYKSVSTQIREIFYEYTDLVEPLSLDEAFLDVTVNRIDNPSATRIALEIKNKIYTRTGGLTASAGVSFNKFLAKVASDYQKPAGITVVTPSQAEDFIDRLPIRKFFGVGKVTEKKMIDLGIRIGADLKRYDLSQLVQLFGKAGRYFYEIAHGIDQRPVKTDWIRKSLGKETTLNDDIDDVAAMLSILQDLAHQVGRHLSGRASHARTVTLKVKFADFQSVTRSMTLPEPIRDSDQIMAYIPKLLSKTDAGEKKVRLLGISLSNFQDPEKRFKQLPLPLEF